jgi:hypothetical protein
VFRADRLRIRSELNIEAYLDRLRVTCGNSSYGDDLTRTIRDGDGNRGLGDDQFRARKFTRKQLEAGYFRAVAVAWSSDGRPLDGRRCCTVDCQAILNYACRAASFGRALTSLARSRDLHPESVGAGRSRR